MQYDYDLYVIGAGSGGVRASRISAGFDVRVAVAESTFLGGTCVNVGCVPKKLFVYGSHFHEEFGDAQGFGWKTGEASFDWPTLRDNKTAEIERLNGIYADMLDSAKVDLHFGHARFVDPHTIEINGKKYTAENILIATGGKPVVPDFEGRELVITSNEVFYLPELPQKVVVVGGGYIAVEFAGIFAGLGVDTTLIYRGPLFLRGFDDSIRAFVRDEIAKKGVSLKFDTQVEKIIENGNNRVLHLNGKHLNGKQQIEADTVLYATGRVPNTTGLDIEKSGVLTGSRGEILIDDYYRTNVEHIYAIGDVTDRIQLTPVAIEEGICIANNLFTNNPRRCLNYENIATAVFCQPNIGTVGLTEAQALTKHEDDLDIFESSFKPMKHTLSGRDERSLMKMIVQRSSGKVLGIHMVGPDAGEVVQGLAVAMVAGATKKQFDATVGVHPTAAEEFVTLREISRQA